MYKKLELTKNNIILDLEKSDYVKVSNWYEAFWIKDIDFDKKNLIIPESKSHKFRVLPINAILEAKLLELKNKSSVSQEFVFKGEKGLMYSDFYHAYVREMKRIQMDGNLHMWRHTYASKLVQKGVSLYVIKDLLGHASIQTTQIYAHLRNEDLHQAVRLLVD